MLILTRRIKVYLAEHMKGGYPLYNQVGFPPSPRPISLSPQEPTMAKPNT